VVQSGPVAMKNVFAFRVIVQSSDRAANYLHSRVEAWLSQFREDLEKMSAPEFEVYRASAIAKREEKPKNLNEETHKWWGEIVLNTYKWDRVDAVVQEYKKLKASDMLKFFDDFVGLGGNRRKLAVQIYGKQHEIPDDSQLLREHKAPPEPVVMKKSQGAPGKAVVTIKGPKGPIELPALLAALPPHVSQQIVAAAKAEASGGGGDHAAEETSTETDFSDVNLPAELISQLEQLVASNAFGDLSHLSAPTTASIVDDSKQPAVLRRAPADSAILHIIHEDEETRFKRSMPLYPASFLPFNSDQVLVFYC